MGEAKTRAERRRAEREAATVTIVDPSDPPLPTRRYRQKLVDFVPEIYGEVVKELEAYNASVEKEQRQGFDAFLNGLAVIAIEYRRAMRAQAEAAARQVHAVPTDIVEQVLAKNRAAMVGSQSDQPWLR